MLKVNHLIGFGYKGYIPASNFSFLSNEEDTSNLSSYSFSVDFGETLFNAYIIVAVESRETNGNDLIGTQPTIDGNSMSIASEVQHISNGRHIAQVCILPWRSGGTHTITWNPGVTCNVCRIGVWRVFGLKSSTPTDTGTDDGNGTTRSISLTVDEGGVGVVMLHMANASASASWSNAVERFDDNGDEAASGADITDSFSGTVTATMSGLGSGRSAMAGAAFR